MLFSIVIPTYNNFDELEQCLRHLGEMHNRDFEVIVCVDGSTDGTAELLLERKFDFPLVVMQHPGFVHSGRSATRNLALSRASGAYTLFLDSDMQAEPDLLDRHLDFLKEGNQVSLGAVEYHNRAQNVWARYTSERGIGKFTHGAKVPFQYFITPNTALATELWVQAGGFDEQITGYGGEDTEMGYRIHLKSNPVFRYNAKAAVKTSQDKTLDEALQQLREFGASGLRYIVRKYPPLKKIYWVYKCESRAFSDQLFGFLTIRPFMEIARFFIRILPYFLQKPLINYLVISNVHRGYRSGKSE